MTRYWNFHDASLTGVQTMNGGMVLIVKDLCTETNEAASARIFVDGASAFKADGAAVERFLMETEDAEILRLDLSEDGISMALVWHDWKTRRQFCRTYEIKAQSVRVELGD